MEPIVDITVTAPAPEWLENLTRELVTSRLIACGNIVAGVRSIYRWRDELQDTSEALVFMHTRATLVAEVTAAVEARHPYETPQVVVLPILRASDAYHRWVLDSTTTPRTVRTWNAAR